MTTPEALKAVYEALGGDAYSATKNVPALKQIYDILGGEGAFPDTIPEAIEKIAEAAEGYSTTEWRKLKVKRSDNNVTAYVYAYTYDMLTRKYTFGAQNVTNTVKTFYVPVTNEQAWVTVSSAPSYSYTVGATSTNVKTLADLDFSLSASAGERYDTVNVTADNATIDFTSASA